MEKEEENDKSVGDKKIDDKKKEFKNSVKDIMRNIRGSPTDKAELKKEAAKEKKKVVSKDVLGDMKASIHEYNDNKNKID
jgi:hypothetical protein